MKTTKNTEELNALQLAHAEAKSQFDQQIATRSADIATFARLEDQLLDAERKVALAAGDEAAVPWPVPPIPSSLSAIKLSDGLRTLLLYAVKGESAPDAKPITAVLDFSVCLSVKHGWPNDEAIEGHRLHGKGLSVYGGFVVENSKWIEELELGNRVHTNHKPEHFHGYKHFILCLKDETIEVVARSASLEIMQDEVFAVVSKVLGRLHFQ